MQVDVQLFAALAEAMGSSSCTLELADGATAGDLLRHLEESFPQFGGRLQQVRVAVDHAFVDPSQPLTPGAEIALIPPVSGGQEDDTWIELTHDVLSVEKAQQFVSSPSCGAIVHFVGVVRNEHYGRAVHRLEYTAYDGMARTQMQQIAQQLRQQWSVERIAILHRLGTLEVGEASIVIALSLPHRKEGFDALRFSIDTFKEVVPIWKKEYFADGEAEWVQGS